VICFTEISCIYLTETADNFSIDTRTSVFDTWELAYQHQQAAAERMEVFIGKKAQFIKIHNSVKIYLCELEIFTQGK